MSGLVDSVGVLAGFVAEGRFTDIRLALILYDIGFFRNVS